MTPKQHLFLTEYLKDCNATQAAIRAGYSARSAGMQGARMMKNVEICAAVKAHLDKAAMSADDVLRSLTAQATFDPAEFYNADGSLKSIHEIPLAVRKALAGLEVTEEYEGAGQERTQIGWTKKVKWTDRLKALELLGKYHKLFTEKVEHEAGGSFADLVLAAQRRREGQR